MKIERVTIEHLMEVARLFDLYRQFYTQPADLDKARRYIKDRIENKESVIYLATDESGRGLGFIQLYASFCSVDAAPIWILYDLYVDTTARQQGVGTALMDQARQLACETGAVRIELETAVENTTAQSVYERLGYARNTEFYGYSLDIR
jgi:ribosomal protein S18 acetylase RimI-like enzyme